MFSRHFPSSTSGSVAAYLPRGQACITCRRKKMKCDGAKPYCSPCAMTRRKEDCEYTDRQGRTQTEILEERLRQLQNRVKELENPLYISTSILLHDPRSASQSSATSSVSSHGSPRIVSGRIKGTEKDRLRTTVPPMLHVDDVHGLFQNFLPHARRLGFYLNVNRFMSSMSLPIGHPVRPHSSLLDVISLWALRIAQHPNLSQLENQYITSAISSMPSALGSATPKHRVQCCQAEILLALYFFCDGRLLEGRYHASAAMSAAVSSGMHQIGWKHYPPSSSLGALKADFASEANRPSDTVELGEKVNVFWSAFLLDRCWSVAISSPPTLMEDESAITTPVPCRSEGFEITEERPTLDDCFASPTRWINTSESFSVRRSQIIAGALFERATRLVSAATAELVMSQSFHHIIASLEDTIMVFNNTLANNNISMFDTVMSVKDRRTFVIAQTLGQASIIQLHYMLSEMVRLDVTVKERSGLLCTEAARQISFIVNQISPEDFEFLDPIIGIVWLSASRILINEVKKLHSRQAYHDAEMVAYELSQILTAMDVIGKSCPLIAFQANGMALNIDPLDGGGHNM